MILVFLGPPGSGKGTQANIIAQKFDMIKISAGDVIREIIKQDTDFAIYIKNIVNSGNLLPDDVVSKIVFDKLNQVELSKGFILDGYPRTVGQANDLYSFLNEKHLSINAVIDLLVEDDIIIKRITGRYICAKCGAIYNKYYNPTKMKDHCDSCPSTEFSVRHDDSEEIIQVRLNSYREQTKPLIDYYSERGLLKQFRADLPIETLASEIAAKV